MRKHMRTEQLGMASSTPAAAGASDAVQHAITDMKTILPTMLELEFPQGAELHFLNCIPDFSQPLGSLKQDMQAMLERLQATGVKLLKDGYSPDWQDVDDVMHWTEGLLDKQYEALNTFLDAAKKQRQQAEDNRTEAVEGNVEAEQGPQAVVEGIVGKKRPRQETRPQDSFPEPIDNSNTPFVPNVAHLEAALGRPITLRLRTESKTAAAENHTDVAQQAADALRDQGNDGSAAGGSNKDRVMAYVQSKPTPTGAADSELPSSGRRQPLGVRQAHQSIYEHPLHRELEELKYQDWQLEATEPLQPQTLEETPLHYIDTPDALQQMAVELEGAREVAIDLEAHTFHSFQGFTCLMQLSSRTADYLVDVLALRQHIGPCLAPLFVRPSTVKVLHGADGDIVWLQRDFGLYVVNMFDTGQASRVLGLAGNGLAFLLQHYCNVKTDKRFQLADWRQRPLSEPMLQYARMDTHYLLYIYDCMKQELVAKKGAVPVLLSIPLPPGGPEGAMGLVLERSRQLCLQMYEKELYRDGQHVAYMERSGMSWSREQQCVLGGLVHWRDTVCRKVDESCGYVLPRAIMLKVAQAMPATASELSRVLGSSCPVAMAHATQVLQVIKQARAQAQSEAVHDGSTTVAAVPTAAAVGHSAAAPACKRPALSPGSLSPASTAAAAAPTAMQSNYSQPSTAPTAGKTLQPKTLSPLNIRQTAVSSGLPPSNAPCDDRQVTPASSVGGYGREAVAVASAVLRPRALQGPSHKGPAPPSSAAALCTNLTQDADTASEAGQGGTATLDRGGAGGSAGQGLGSGRSLGGLRPRNIPQVPNKASTLAAPLRPTAAAAPSSAQPTQHPQLVPVTTATAVCGAPLGEASAATQSNEALQAQGASLPHKQAVVSSAMDAVRQVKNSLLLPFFLNSNAALYSSSVQGIPLTAPPRERHAAASCSLSPQLEAVAEATPSDSVKYLAGGSGAHTPAAPEEQLASQLPSYRGQQGEESTLDNQLVGQHDAEQLQREKEEEEGIAEDSSTADGAEDEDVHVPLPGGNEQPVRRAGGAGRRPYNKAQPGPTGKGNGRRQQGDAGLPASLREEYGMGKSAKKARVTRGNRRNTGQPLKSEPAGPQHSDAAAPFDFHAFKQDHPGLSLPLLTGAAQHDGKHGGAQKLHKGPPRPQGRGRGRALGARGRGSGLQRGGQGASGGNPFTGLLRDQSKSPGSAQRRLQGLAGNKSKSFGA